MNLSLHWDFQSSAWLNCLWKPLYWYRPSTCLIKKQDDYLALHHHWHANGLSRWPTAVEIIESFTSWFSSDFLFDIHSFLFFFFSPQVTLWFERNASLHYKRDTLQGKINEGAIVWYCPHRTVKRILWLFIIPSALWPESGKAIYQYSKCSHSKKMNKSRSIGERWEIGLQISSLQI